ncbi:MAG: hypothetical protein DMF08_02740 [Verrucomicrobia bacterium]|nr:MAG: hypothetical protein DMF08_02740 [Verrucomicrobiota bacterium]
MAMIHINRGTTSLGVFSEQEVREGLTAGRFAATDIGWREGMATWQPLSQFPEFGGAAAPAVPPVQSGATPTSTAVAGRTGLPWEHRQERGFFNAFIETLTMVLTRPAEAFSVMKREGGLGEPLMYALIGGCLGGIVAFLFTLGFRSIGLFADRDSSLAAITGMGIGSVAMIVLLPLFIAIGLFIGSGIVHLCLMIVGGANQPFETTFRVLVCNCIGLARAHGTDTGRAVLAVFLPLIVCCGGGVLIAFMFMGAWTASHH